MKPVEVIELYIPHGEEFGWIRTRGRWSGISTFMVNATILDGMAQEVTADPDLRPVIDPFSAMRSREYARSWPPNELPRVWVVRTASGGGKTAWVRRV
jgi:hypothetical protein